jgi:uridine kinase
MKQLSPAIQDLELYEFRYGLDNVTPAEGWNAVRPDSPEEIERRVNSREFYVGIKIKSRVNDQIVLDQNIARLTQMLLVGLVNGAYTVEWINTHFYFDVRGFYFLHRVIYFTPPVVAHLGGTPLKQFEQKQKRFERFQGVGYKDFLEANAEIDRFFVASAQRLIAEKGTPILFAIAGGTAAGKTEIVERLRDAFEQNGRRTTSIELDNFFTDRDYREAKGIDSLGREAYHFGLFKQALEDILQGKKITIPRYDTIHATSSHDLDGILRPGAIPIKIDPADIIFIEGNFPFLLPEIAPLIGVKVVYLTDDAVRLKRKWKRDIDYRKKYEPTYFRNRFFKDQFLMAQKCYLPQLQVCDLAIDTTGAALWATPEIAKVLAGA